MTLQFNFSHLPGTNNQQIQGAPPASLPHWWIVCFCFRWPWWDASGSGWHWHQVWMILFDCLLGLLFQCTCIYVRIACLFLSFLNVARQTINVEEHGSWYDWKVIMNDNSCGIFTVEGNWLLVDILWVSDNACSPPNEYIAEPRHLSASVCDFHFGSVTVPGEHKALCMLRGRYGLGKYTSSILEYMSTYFVILRCSSYPISLCVSPDEMYWNSV